MKKILIFGAIALVIAFALIRNSGFGNQAPVVETEVLEKRTIRASILASGQIGHEEEALLSTEVIGRVTDLYVKEGDRVEKGQLLLQIDDETIAANVEQQQANVRIQEIAIQAQQLRVENLEKQWNRQQRLHEQGLVDTDTFEIMDNEFAVAKIDLLSRRESLIQAQAILQESENQLDKTRVYSPITGVITSLDIEVGETAISSTTNVPGSSLMTIANPDSVLTEVNVDEADIANVAIGQEVEIVAIAYPNQPMRGVVDSIAMSAKQAEGSQSLSFVVKILFTDTNDVVLRSGMSCRAEIFTHQGEPVLATLIQAIRIEENLSENLTDYNVFIYDDGTARRQQIEVGVADDQYQEVVAGLEEGDQVIVGPDNILRILNDGDSIALSENSVETESE